MLVKFPGSSWDCAVRLHPDSSHAVLASAGTGSVDVVEVSTGERCPRFAGVSSQHMEVDAGEATDALDALYSSVAISQSCRQVAFGGFDGIISLYDVRRGCLLASATAPAPQPAVTALGFCSMQASQILAAGLADGRVALSPLEAWQVCLGDSRCGGARCGLLGCNWDCGSASFSSRQVNGPWVTCSLGAGVEVRRIKGDHGAGAGLSVVAGTSGGHVMVVDGAVGRVRSSLVGSCSCPVKCLSLHSNEGSSGQPIPEPQASGLGLYAGQSNRQVVQAAPQALSRVVYAGFDHHMLGNGHYNAIYVWDVNSAERVALLHPGDTGLKAHRGGRGVCCRRQSSNDLSRKIQSVWSDGWKVAVSAGKSVTVFETRTWRPLYELSISSPPCDDVEGAGASRGAARPLAPLNLERRLAQQVGASPALVPCSFPSGKGRLDVFGSSVHKGKTQLGAEFDQSDMVPSVACSTTESCRNSSPSPERRKASFEKSRTVEEVSESPGALAFFGSTMAVGLKADQFALISFSEALAQESTSISRLGVQVKRLT